ncbi:MAG: reverse transcriptase/maturase family protein [Patescibacteria group bacterium]|jgi:retron-type reverse transcriptase
MKIYKNLFAEIISSDNLFASWTEFRRGKGRKEDVAAFEFELEQNIFKLQRELTDKTYCHGAYTSFYINDPKRRHIHKATVPDRVLHHAIFRILNPIYDQILIPDSFSCRLDKGTHRGVNAAERMIRTESRNYIRLCYILKCDVKQFFASVDHQILLMILKKKIKDTDTFCLLEKVIKSFPGGQDNLFSQRGLPIGNLTSQLFANIYLNELDQFVKRELKIKHYARYTDDFIIISQDKLFLEEIIPLIKEFLKAKLKLEIHPNKISISPYHRGLDFLGYITLPHYRLLRKRTKRRICRKLRERVSEFKTGAISEEDLNRSLQSFLGVLSHANAHKLTQDLKNKFWFWLKE